MRRQARRGLLAALVMATGVMSVSASGQVHANSVNPARARSNLDPTWNAMEKTREAGLTCLRDGVTLDSEWQKLQNNQGNEQTSLNDAITTANDCYNDYPAVAGLSFSKSLPYFHMVLLYQSMEKELVARLYWMGKDMQHLLNRDNKATILDVEYNDDGALTANHWQHQLVTGLGTDVHAAPHIIVPALLLRKALPPPRCRRITCL